MKQKVKKVKQSMRKQTCRNYLVQYFKVLQYQICTQNQQKFTSFPLKSMKYRQDAKLNSNKTKFTQKSGLQVEQIVFDKEITQQWKVDTDEPTELLPYGIKKIYLSRLCDFWHQIKFFYHEHYQQLSQPHTQTHNAQIQVQEIESYSSVEVVHSAETIENCKRISKVIWKIMRQRLLKSFNNIKEKAGIEEEESLQLEDEKLRSYMIFLKLQENKTIDLAVQIFDSVVEKNIRRKLLNAFLNMREQLKIARKKETYHDRIKLECFAEIAMRNIKKINSHLIVDSFCQIFQFYSALKMQQEYEREQKRRRKSQTSNKEHYKSISNRKVINDEEQSSEWIQKRDTVTKQQNKKQTHSKQTRPNQNHISTVKRQNLQQKQLFHHSNTNSITSEYLSNLKQSQQKIIHSHYYYEEHDDQHFNQDNPPEYPNLTHPKFNNMNSLPTRRQVHSTKNYLHSQNNTYLISGVENNINSQTLYQQQKTTRTPSRSDVNNKSLLSHQNQHHQSFKPTHEDLHIPVTQRIDQHFHSNHYQEVLQEISHNQAEDSQENIHQQICVIRNFSTTPTRKPDRYEKIPIVSSNIQFKQFFLNSKEKKSHRHFESHSSSFYEKKICSECMYCAKLAKVQQMVEQIAKNRKSVHTEKIILENVVTKKEIFIGSAVENEDKDENQQTYLISSENFSQKPSKTNKKEYGPMHLDIDKINQNLDQQVQSNKINYIKSNLRVSDEAQSNKKTNKMQHSPNSPLLVPLGQLLHTPSSQVSAFTEGARSKGLSERKIFKRKPNNQR